MNIGFYVGEIADSAIYGIIPCEANRSIRQLLTVHIPQHTRFPYTPVVKFATTLLSAS